MVWAWNVRWKIATVLEISLFETHLGVRGSIGGWSASSSSSSSSSSTRFCENFTAVVGRTETPLIGLIVRSITDEINGQWHKNNRSEAHLVITSTKSYRIKYIFNSSIMRVMIRRKQVNFFRYKGTTICEGERSTCHWNEIPLCFQFFTGLHPKYSQRAAPYSVLQVWSITCGFYDSWFYVSDKQDVHHTHGLMADVFTGVFRFCLIRL